MNKYMKSQGIAILMVLLTVLPLALQASPTVGGDQSSVLYLVAFIAFSVLILIFFVLMFLLQMLRHMMYNTKSEGAEAASIIAPLKG